MKAERGVGLGVGPWLAAAVLQLALPASAGETHWRHDPAMPGDWFADANWTHSVPTGDDDAYIDNGGTAEIAAAGARAGGLYAGYAASGGVLQTGGDLSADPEYIGFSGTGSFTHSAGSNTAGALVLGFETGSGGAYSLSGTARLAAVGEVVGAFGTGTFTHAGGTNAVTGGLCLGRYYGARGAYALSGTGAFSASDAYVGYWGTGSFTQTGGTCAVVDDLDLGSQFGSDGTYAISAGTLQAGSLLVGSDGQGTLEIIGSSAEIAVSKLLRFGAESSLSADQGSRVRMTGASLENESTAPGDLAGLGNLTLVFEGGDVIDEVEVAGEDMGPQAQGWTDNFALGGLTLGGAAPGRIRLMDAFDNRPAWAGREAMYVGSLVLNPGAAIELSGLNLYYLNGGPPKQLFRGDCDLNGKVDYVDLGILATHYDGTGKTWQEGEFTGEGRIDYVDLGVLATYYDCVTAGRAVPVPEPGGLSLLGVGAWVCVLRRLRACPRGTPTAGGRRGRGGGEVPARLRRLPG